MASVIPVAPLKAATVAPAVDSSECHRIRPNLIPRLQPHGMFAWLAGDELRIQCASSNLNELSNGTHSDVLSRALGDLVENSVVEQLRECVQRLQGQEQRQLMPLRFSNGLTSDGLVFRSAGGICLEFDRPTEEQPAQVPFELIHSMEQELDAYEGDADALASVLCRILRKITGYGRAYYCHFEQDGHGYVPGEDIGEGWSSLLDHHFPASDVPDGARAVYMRNPFRQIVDAQAQDIPLLYAEGVDTPVLDLTLSNCRAFAPSHLAYLKNMGVRTSASFSVIRDGRLLGLFGLHNDLPRHLSFRQLSTCYRFVNMYANRHAALRAQENHSALITRARALHQALHIDKASIGDQYALPPSIAQQLAALFNADGIICRIHGEIQTHGLINRHIALDLLRVLQPKVCDDQTVLTHEAAALMPELAHLQSEIAGVCALGLDRKAENMIVWVRHERALEVKWSGDPDQPIRRESDERLTPRKSFDTFVRQTRGTSEPWEDWHKDFAEMVRRVVNQTLLTLQSEIMRGEAERANQLKSEFVANVSHELRSPLHSIIGLSESLQRRNDKLSSEQRVRYADTINRSSERLLALINNLLDLAKLEAGRMELSFVEADLGAVLAEVTDELEPLAAGKHVSLQVNDARSCRRSRFDRTAIHSLFTNLVSNAIKFTKEHSCIDIELIDDVRQETHIIISDHGPGIDDAELELIFDKFVQSSRTKTGAGGTGLGLAICREIVASHNGFIYADNNQHGGASFRVRLPLDPAGAEASDKRDPEI